MKHRGWAGSVAAELVVLALVSCAGIVGGIQALLLPPNAFNVNGTLAGGYVFFLGLVLGCMTIAYGARSRGLERVQLEPALTTNARRVWLALGALAAYVVAIMYLGYVISTAIFLAIYLKGFGSYRWLPVILFSALLAMLLAYLWIVLLGMTLPTGPVDWP